MRIQKPGNVILTNNTITGNQTSLKGGGLYLECTREDTLATVYNNIIWGNEGGESDDIYNDSHIYAITNVSNNNYHDTAGRQFTENVNNIDKDPLFVDSEQGDYRLLSDSPCIDKGTADAPELPTTDFEGDSRTIGDAPDIGADEFDPSAPPPTTSSTISTTTTIEGETSTTSTGNIPTTTTSSPSCPSELIYGKHSEQTELLRYIRDNVLSQSPEGQEIIRLYYELSPAIVHAMEGDEEFKEEVQEMVDGILEMVGGEME